MDPMRPSHCDEVPELIPAYALQALPRAEQTMVEEHVPKCPDCRTLLADHQALAEGLLYTAPPVAAPPHLEADLRRRLAEARAKEPRTGPLGPSDPGSMRFSAQLPGRPWRRRRWSC